MLDGVFKGFFSRSKEGMPESSALCPGCEKFLERRQDFRSDSENGLIERFDKYYCYKCGVTYTLQKHKVYK